MSKKKRKKKSNALKIGYGEWYGGGNTTYSTGKVIHRDKLACVTDPTTNQKVVVPLYGYQMDFKDLKEAFGCRVEGDAKSGLVEVVDIPDEFGKLLTVVKLNQAEPMMCLYTAISEYCESLLGVKLNDDDKKFFKQHPLAEKDGIPFPDTLRVAQELIEPYGLRVSRVQTRPNFGVKGDLLQWRKVLGCNPLAYADRMTSNVEFAKKLGLEGKEDLSKYRFEYTDTALYPAICCGEISGGYESGATGYSNGHAIYLPPRRRVSGAMLSFQIDHARNVPWKAAPEFPTLAAGEAKTVLCWDLDEWWKSHRPKKDYSSSNNGGGIVHAISETFKGFTGKAKKPKCFMCHRHDSNRKHTYEYPGICDECWNLFISEHYCAVTACQDAASASSVPHFTLEAYHQASDKIYVRCNGCKKVYTIDKKDKTYDDYKACRRMFKALELYMQANSLKVYSVRLTSSTEETNTDAIPSSD